MKSKQPSNFTNHFLINVSSEEDNIFNRTVVYITSHTISNGAIGVIINRPIHTAPLNQMLNKLSSYIKTNDLSTINEMHVANENKISNDTENDYNVYFGGPIDKEIGFLLLPTMEETHKNTLDAYISSQKKNKYSILGSMQNNDIFNIKDLISIKNDTMKFELTNDLSLVKQMKSKCGNMFVAFGYAAWSPLQLEQEIIYNIWLPVLADENIIFKTEPSLRYQAALELLGITQSNKLYIDHSAHLIN